MKEPVRHHYIPQFILRNFKREDGYVSYYDCSKGSVESKRTEEIFMTRNLYRDTINHPDEPVKIEKDLARFENEASKIINKFLKDDEVVLSVEEDDCLKLFFAIMGFRADRVKEMFSESVDDEFKEFYSIFQKDGDLTDFWKRNLGILVNCRSLKQVLDNPNIDSPVKAFMVRDTCGLILTGLYFLPVEVRGGEDFMISDCYPAVFDGISEDGMTSIPMYSVYPISPKRALFLMADGVENAPSYASGFDKNFFRKPIIKRDGKTAVFRMQKIYETEVKNINDTLFRCASEGTAFIDKKRIHNITED